MKNLLLSMLAVALVFGSALRATAKDDAPVQDTGMKPVAVVTIASYERLMTDVAFIGSLAGSPDLDKNLEAQVLPTPGHMPRKIFSRPRARRLASRWMEASNSSALGRDSVTRLS